MGPLQIDNGSESFSRKVVGAKNKRKIAKEVDGEPRDVGPGRSPSTRYTPTTCVAGSPSKFELDTLQLINPPQ
jgi:hypothetical protein